MEDSKDIGGQMGLIMYANPGLLQMIEVEIVVAGTLIFFLIFKRLFFLITEFLVEFLLVLLMLFFI